MRPPSAAPRPAFLRTVLAAASATLLASGCAVVSVAGAVVGTTISVAGAVVGTTVSVAGKVVEKTIDVVVPSSSPPAP